MARVVAVPSRTLFRLSSYVVRGCGCGLDDVLFRLRCHRRRVIDDESDFTLMFTSARAWVIDGNVDYYSNSVEEPPPR
jgi:hypothetical protein